MEIIGSMYIKSRGGNRHVLVVVDDFSRYSFVNFLRQNLETIGHLKSSFNIIQVEIGHPIVSNSSLSGT